MAKKGLEIKVGIFVLIGLILSGLLLLQFSKGTSFFRPTYKIYLTAKNIGGLKKDASVLMAGVQVGTVSDYELDPTGTNVTITLSLYSKYTIHKDALFKIKQANFLADQYVSIEPTRNEDGVFQPGDHAVAEEPLDLQEIVRSAGGFIQRVDETARELNEAIADVRRLALNEQTLSNVSATVSALRLASDRALITVDTINALLATNGPYVSQSASNLVTFSQDLTHFADTLNGLVETNRGDVNAAVKNIESSTVMLKTLLAGVQAGKGPAGTLLRNDQVATNIAEIVNNLSITTSNLNRLGLWGILWSKKPPKPPEKQSGQLTTPRNPFD